MPPTIVELAAKHSARVPRRRSRAAVACLLAAGGLSIAVLALAPPMLPGAPSHSEAIARGAVLPAFIPNHGQLPDDVAFAWRHTHGMTEFRAGQMVHHLVDPMCTVLQSSAAGACAETFAIALGSAGAALLPEARVRSEAVVTILGGSDPATWLHEVPTYDGLRYQGIAPGVDLDIDHVDGRIKATWHVAPGADPGLIAWRYDLDVNVELARDGSIIARRKGRAVAGFGLGERPPIAWQERRNGRVDVPVAYRIGDGSVGFELGPYDVEQPLIIDPEIVFVAHLGHTMSDVVTALATNDAGETIVVGDTYSGRFPVAQVPMPLPVIDRKRSDVFVSKLAPDGRLIKTVLLEGGSTENSHAQDVVWEPGGHVIVIGNTKARNFPNTDDKGPGRKVIQGEPADLAAATDDLFITKLDFDSDDELQTGITGRSPEPPYHTYSTYFGGGGSDLAKAAVLDKAGNLVMVAATQSVSTFGVPQEGVPLTPRVPISRSAQVGNRGGWDGLVFAINPTGSQLVWATYLGGALDDDVTAVTIADDGGIWIGGSSASTQRDFCRPEICNPLGTVADPLSATRISQGADRDAFVALLGTATTAGQLLRMERLAWLGGSGDDTVLDIAAAGTDALVLVGSTRSTDVRGVAPRVNPGLGDAMAAGLHVRGDELALAWMDVWGSERSDEARRVRVNPDGYAIVVGTSAESAGSIDERFPGNPGDTSAQLSIFDPSGQRIHRSRMSPSAPGNSSGNALDLGPNGEVWLGGQMRGTFLGPPAPTPGMFGRGSEDGFVARIAGIPIPSPTSIPTDTPTQIPTPTPTATETPVATATPTPTLTPTPDPVYLPMVLGRNPRPPQDLFTDVVLTMDASTQNTHSHADRIPIRHPLSFTWTWASWRTASTSSA